MIGKDIWDERFKSIREFERHLARNGVLVLKFFLHVSKEEQRQRFLARLEEPAKRWKFEMGDVAERKLWDKYMHAYEDAIRHTSRPEAPWYVVPADNKWFARLVIAEAMVEAMEGLDLRISQGRGRGAEGARRRCAARCWPRRRSSAEMTFAIRRYRDADHAAVRDLFIRVNRELAPPASARRVRELRRQVRCARRSTGLRITTPRKQGAFFVAYDGDTFAGMFGLEGLGTPSAELRRMYVDAAYRGSGLARAMLELRRATRAATPARRC